MRNPVITVLAFAAVTFTPAASAELQILVDGQQRPEYSHRGTTYVEALRGREYSLRITNPTPHRVAVALAVDGLNTIDAKHTSGWDASKWVLGPYESAVISGWQVNDSTARRFLFTGERQSYGAFLGATDNLGIIEAVFYRERVRKTEFERRESMLQEAPSARDSAAAAPKALADDEYAATGMGNRTQHDVEHVNIDLDPRPFSSVR
ncbi:MAG TPA: hypothetical protein VGQ76_14655, partial [Thermoanaerobaculia bacterium]|nr:hypothetical protein [Thermoanaerobaculia bacterium]